MDLHIIFLIAVLVILIVIILLCMGSAADNFKLTRLFYNEGCNPTKRIGRLWIDENTRRWAAPAASRLYSYEEIYDFDILVDGVSLGGKSACVGIDACGSEAAASSNKTFERIVVLIFVGKRASDVINIPVCGCAVRNNSNQFDKYMALATEMCGELEKMKNNR